jgi:hypothetical protein
MGASTTSNCDRLATTGSAPPAQVRSEQSVPPRPQLYHVGFVVARILPAQNGVACDDDEATAERSGFELPPNWIAHEQMASEGRNNQSIKGVRHTAG